MKQKRAFTKSLIRPIFNALIGLIMLLSAAIGTVGYFEFTGALKQQYMEIANGIAEYAALSIDAETLEQYLETKTADEAYNRIRDQLQHTADAEDCSVIYAAKVHTDTKSGSTSTMSSAKPAVFPLMRSDSGTRSTMNF